MGLDTVELILAFEETFGVSFPESEAETLLTTRNVSACIFAKIKSDLPEDRGCLSMRAFFRLRKAFESEGVPRLSIRPESRVSDLLPGRRRRDILSAVLVRAGLEPLRPLPFGLQFTSGRVRDIATDAVIRHHRSLRLAGHGWSQAQVREIVRAIMFTQFSLARGFSDDARIVDDLGLD